MTQQLQMCYRCGVEKPLNDQYWYRKKIIRGKENPYYIPCKECRRAMMRQYMAQKKEGIEREPVEEDLNIQRCSVCYTKYMEDEAFVVRIKEPKKDPEINICYQCTQELPLDPDKFNDTLDLLYRYKLRIVNNVRFPVDNIPDEDSLEPWHQDYINLIRKYNTLRRLYNFVKKV